MFLTQVSSILGSYVTWTSVAAICSLQVPFMRKYLTETIDHLHQNYLVRPLESHVLWLRNEVQLSVHCTTARLELHTILANPTLVSSEIAETFKDLEAQYPLQLVKKGKVPSHIYYLQHLLNTLEASEQAFHEIEYLNLDRNQSKLDRISNIITKVPKLVDDLFELVVLIDKSPHNLQPCISPIKDRLLPKLQTAISQLQKQQGPVKTKTKTLAHSANNAINGILPGKTINQIEARQLMLNCVFQLPNIFGTFNGAVSDQQALYQLTPEHIEIKMKQAHKQLEGFIDATHSISTWYHYIQCIKEISVLGGTVLNNSHNFSELMAKKIIDRLKHTEELIPNAIDELAELEIKFHLPLGLLTKPGTLYIENYFLLISQYTEILAKTSMGISDVKTHLKENHQKTIQWITEDPIQIDHSEPSDAIANFQAPASIQNHFFVQKRHYLILNRRAELEANLHATTVAKTMFHQFYEMLLKINEDVELKGNIQLTITTRLKLIQKYKVFQRYVRKSHPEINKIIYKHLEITAAEKLKLITECQLSQKDKAGLKRCLQYKPEHIYEFISKLPYNQTTLDTLNLIFEDSSCHSTEFIKLLPLIPDSYTEKHFPRSWYKKLTIDDVLDKNTSDPVPITKPSEEKTWTETFAYGISQFSLALYGIHIVSQGLSKAWDLNTVFNAKNDILQSIEEGSCDAIFAMDQLNRQVENTLDIKFEADEAQVRNHEQNLLTLYAQFTQEHTKISQKLETATEALSKAQYLSKMSSDLKEEVQNHKKNKDDLQKKYLEQKIKIENKIKQIVLPRYSNTHYDTITLPENLDHLSKDELNNQLKIFSSQEQLLLKQQNDLSALFQLLEEGMKVPKETISELPSENLKKLAKLLFNTQIILNSCSNSKVDYEKIFINAFTPPCQTQIEIFLKLKKSLMTKVKKQVNQLQTDKVILEAYQRKKHQQEIALSPFVSIPEGTEHQDNLQLFKTITSLQLEPKIKKLRTEIIPNKLKELLSNEVLKKIDLDNIQYSITDVYAHTQTEAIYLHLLNALYHLEKSLKSFDDLQKLSESSNIFIKGYYIYTIISELVVNAYSTYYYLNADQKHPKIQTIFSEALKIISPLEELPILAPHIASAKQSINPKKNTIQTPEPTDNIIQKWQQQMLLLKKELGPIEFSIDEPSLAIQTPVITLQESLINTEEENPIDLLKNAYWVLEIALQHKKQIMTEEEISEKANTKSKAMFALTQNLSLASPDTIKPLIVEASEIISNISRIIYDEPTLRQTVMELTERSLNKLYRISDNTETSIGLKPNIISGKATKEFFKWINKLIKPAGLELDTESIEHLHFVVLSNNKRIKNLENKITSLKKNNSSRSIKTQIFGSGTEKNNAPFNVISSLDKSDFSDSTEGNKNRELFLVNYEKIQPHLCQIDYTFDTDLFLREQLQTSKDFQTACKKINSLHPEIQRYIDTINRDTQQQVLICQEHITNLKEQRKNDNKTLFLKAKQNAIELEKSLFDGNIKKHRAANSMLAQIHNDYLQNYHHLLNNFSQVDIAKESFRDQLAAVEKNRNNAIELYKIGHDMLRLFDHLSSKLKDPKMVQKQYIKDKQTVLNKLRDDLDKTLFKSPELTVLQQEQQLKEIYQDFEAAAPQLHEFTDSSFKQIIYNCLTYLNQLFGNYTVQKNIDYLFINKQDQDFSREIEQNSLKKHQLFNFFSVKEPALSPKITGEPSPPTPKNSE